MKKPIKIFLRAVLSLLALIIILIVLTFWFVFTPAKLTPLVQKQADKFLTCKSEIGEVELTFFSSFPNFGLKVKQFVLINPMLDAPSDTLMKVEELEVIVDAKAWWKNGELIFTGFELSGGSINVFTDSLGNTNYNITDRIPASNTDSETELPHIDLRKVVINDVNLHYQDISLKLNTVIHKLNAKFTGTIYSDSISGTLNVIRSQITLEYVGKKYFQEAGVQFDMPLDFIPSRQLLKLKNAKAAINDLEFLINSSIEYDSNYENLITNLEYKLSSSPLKNALAMVPLSYQSYFKGIDIDGFVSSQGSINGIYNDSLMPLFNINLLVKKGRIKSVDFPLILHDIDGDFIFYSDLTSDSLSFVRINRFNAKTPQSTIKLKGLVNHLFTDIYFDLTTDVNLKMDEFNPMIPDSLKMEIKGRASGNMKTAFSLSQLENIQLEKMKLSGFINLTDFTLNQDSISLKTENTKIEFSFPNQKAATKNTKFAFGSFYIDNMQASKLKSYYTSFLNAAITIETSDFRETDRIPDLICSFKLDSLYAEMDSISIALEKPYGKVSLSPRIDKPNEAAIKLIYTSKEIKSAIGQNSARLKNIDLETDILNDNTQKDIFQQWLTKGFIDINQATIKISGLAHPIEIPSVKMNFEPETFLIKEAKVQIDKSDFELSGKLNNVLSYFRGDSILKGNFNFASNTTDVSQLMALTNGIGNAKNDEQSEIVNSSSTGPYMVPKGIDVSLNANIKMATMGKDTATNIRGNVRVKDGILLLDELKFKTPAARMQLTAMYRTPRKNHLFLGLDYHMLDVEIAELLTMIPDIDTLLPMLRSFGGKGEFHFAGETYLDSLYNLKKSTIRGASSIKGNNLVLMDGETFSEIAKTLNFNKKTVNNVDSLSAEITIFRDEIDVYPFLIVMDKYKAVIAGRHNFDLSFNYHISVVDSQFPIKLGIDINGNMDNLSYKLAKCRYAQYYRPASRKIIESKQLELRKMIRNTLTEKVKE